MGDPMNIGSGLPPTQGETLFRERLDKLYRPRILELGTMRWDPNLITHHKHWAPEADWTLSDIAPGPDVDEVADAHSLYGLGPFDAYIAVSLYEHLERPWLAAAVACQALRPGGLLYVMTHQTFPLHGYPNDYFRFSDQALDLIFEDAGFQVLHSGCEYPCYITPPPEVTRWNPGAPAYLISEITAVRPD